MDKNCHSSAADSSSTTSHNSSNNNDHFLKHLNKLSHKIAKPSTAPLHKKPTFDSLSPPQNLPQVTPPQVQPQPQNQSQNNLQAHQQHQPPVYNINKNDFRDVVQKLTGSPAHERFSTPPPINQPKPQSSRLQRIRPPPLAQISNRPPPLLNCTGPNLNPNCRPNVPVPAQANAPVGGGFLHRPTAPLSPLPPLPAVHAAAESPVSAYMRYLQNSVSTIDSNPKQFSGFSPLAPLVSPRWNNMSAPQQLQQPPPPPPQPQQGTSTGMMPSQLPTSPLPFGCLNSPRSAYPLLSPSLLFSPNSGQLGFPLSPTVPVPSPKWRGL